MATGNPTNMQNGFHLTAEDFAKAKSGDRTKAWRAHAASPDDEIVISGVSGRFPMSENMDQFSHNLYNKVRNDGGLPYPECVS